MFALIAVVIGIVLAAIIQQLTGYFTETNRRPVRDIGKTSLTGPATVILAGDLVGLESAVYSALIVAAAVYGAFLLGGGITVLSLFAVALAGTGLLTTVGVIVAMDTFGPVSDNAQGIAEMSGDVTGEGAEVLTQLDAVGNTTKAITKGIAIATAVLAATALFGSFTSASDGDAKAGTSAADVQASPRRAVDRRDSPNVIVGAIIGAAVVFFFSGLAISAVARAAGAVVFEVRRQFREHPRDHGRHRAAGVRPGRRHRHQGLASRARHARTAGGARARSPSASRSESVRSPPTSRARSPQAC